MELQYHGSGKTFYKEKEYKCNLYLNEKEGGILLKIIVNHGHVVGDYLELPFEIDKLPGELSSGFKFVLLRLKRTGMQDFLASGFSEYTFQAAYILHGIELVKHKEITFHKARYTLSNIVEWGEETIYHIGENYELTSKEEKVCKCLYTGCEFAIDYSVHGSYLPVVEHELLAESIKLEQHGVIEISFKREVSFDSIDQVFNKLKRLIEIASLRKINVERLDLYSGNFLQRLGDQEYEQEIEVHGITIRQDEKEDSPKGTAWKWISLSELIKSNVFEQYFEKHEKLAPIIELFMELFYVENYSVTRVFLNVVQALETYHSRFITNDLDEYKKRVEDYVEKKSEEQAEQVKNFLMAKSKRFITLESRIADLLLADYKIYFDTGEIKYLDFPSVVARTRNYYIHYDEKIREEKRVFSEEELQIYNRGLLKILEYYILLELGLAENEDDVQKKLTNRWGSVSQDLDIIKASQLKHRV